MQAGASGSGNACVQVAHALGARVASTVGSEAKIETAANAGAELVINYNKQQFADVLLDWTDGVGVDVVIDNVGLMPEILLVEKVLISLPCSLTCRIFLKVQRSKPKDLYRIPMV